MLALLAAAVCTPLPARADAGIWIKTGRPYSVTGGDDVQRLQYLASGVGWEFEPNAGTTAALRQIGVKTIRCINVDVDGGFDAQGHYVVKSGNSRLEAHLATCRSLGAVPHVIIAQGVPPELLVKEQDVTDPALKQRVREEAFGPTDWTKFRSYIEAYFEYVLITAGFPNAEFEVANEPDEGGGIVPSPPHPPMGSRAAYEAAFNLYKQVAEAAVSFEQKHPGIPLKLGGPALAWPFTFRNGELNWVVQFLQDCQAQRVKLDFLGIHYYGNFCSLDGEWPSPYPPFTEMMRTTQAAINDTYPGLPVQFTEWGPSTFTDTSVNSAVNANLVGAAWGAAYLNTMLSCGVSKALYLVTTDYREQDDGKWVDVWGWDSLFLNPGQYEGRVYPKPMYHLFEMISRLVGRRVQASRPSDSANCFVSADPAQRKITLLVWNYGGKLGPEDPRTVPEQTQVHVRDAGNFFHAHRVNIETWQINADTDNIYKLLTTGVAPDEKNTAMAVLPTTTAQIKQGALEFPLRLPPSSVSLVVLTETQ